ncbi:MAG TPA: GlsB/YeaQ/YmgE family stress response membrane protein [Bryobacterales bacterium]|nr:GlsB/YeaQ/YmgE family stress response membrane protein [Bryobacterales bacterium]
MAGMHGTLGFQGVGLVLAIVIGGLAGLIAEKITGADHGLLKNIGLGIAGALFMKFVLRLLGIRLMFAGWFVGNLIIATAGAVLLILIWRAVKGRA